jgi:hypothetical protein
MTRTAPSHWEATLSAEPLLAPHSNGPVVAVTTDRDQDGVVMHGESATAHWRQRLIDRMLFDSGWPRNGKRPVPGNPHRGSHVVRALYGGHGPALLVCTVVAAGVVAPGWMFVLGAMASVPGWVVLLGATVATVLAYVAVTIATDLQRTLIREMRVMRSRQQRCTCCHLERPVGPGATRWSTRRGLRKVVDS